MTASTSDSATKDNELFIQMLNLINPKYYFTEEEKRLVRGDIDEDIEEENYGKWNGRKSKKRVSNDVSNPKSKRSKFDPLELKSVSQLAEEIVDKKSEDSGDKNKTSSVEVTTCPTTDLHEKLQSKLELFKAKRKALEKTDEIKKKRLKRNEIKAKRKIKQNFQKQQRISNGPVSKKSKAAVSSKPVFNKEGNMVFSKFDFSEKKSAKPEKKSFKKLLEKAQHNKEKIEKLEQADGDAAKSLKQKQQWQNVLKKAEGVKIKDNPELIKKSMKKREKRKEKSQKEWVKRTEQVETKKKKKQDKRQSNIKKKKDSRINKKISKAKKKGRIIPGF